MNRYLLSIITGFSLIAPSEAVTTITGSNINFTQFMTGGGSGVSPMNDFFGIVTNASPIQINGNTGTNINSAFSPALGDVIGRDLEGSQGGSSHNFTGDSTTWQLGVPAVTDPSYIAGTFTYSIAFNADSAFTGNAFDGGTQTNALNFELFVDGVSVSTFQSRSGDAASNAISLTATQAAGAPISTVTVVMTFPDGNSFDAANEQFHVFNDAFSVNYTYDIIPEPTTSIILLSALPPLMRRKRKPMNN